MNREHNCISPLHNFWTVMSFTTHPARCTCSLVFINYAYANKLENSESSINLEYLNNSAVSRYSVLIHNADRHGAITKIDGFTTKCKERDGNNVK